MGQLDTRILSLYSRDSRQEKFRRLGDGQYYSFCFYDAIEAVKADCGGGDACRNLLSAYEAAAAGEERLYASRQFLLAFADVREENEPAPGRGCCHKRKDIEDFWDGPKNGERGENRRLPIFFVTMINLRDNRRLDDALSKIDRIFAGEQYLTYLTFDHCDLLLFCRSGGFCTYADKIFQLNYGTDLVEDSITLYSFDVRAEGGGEEKFGVYLRFGIRNYDAANRFVGECREQGAEIGRLLGRNDMGVYKKDADMPWLKTLIEKTLDAPQPWYTTYELSVLIEIPKEGASSWTAVSGDPEDPKKPKDPVDRGIGGVMEDALNGFLAAYRTGPAGMAEDPVWTHWLGKTSSLAVSLYEDRLAMDFGTCLVPQFLDLFSYAGRLLRSEALSPADQDNVWDIFSAFFSSTSILMDSINHSSRQFVQVPSFGSVSFEMPPKLMAYYTAMTHELIEVFRDDGYTYGVAFCPEFVYTLKVTSYADQDISKDEWLTISVGERSLYTLQLTTETLGHEISHFVGGRNRRRDVRKIRALQTGLAGLAARLLNRLNERLARYCGREEPFSAGAKWSGIHGLVDKLVETMTGIGLPEWAEEELYSRRLQNCLANLPNDILSVPRLTDLLKEWLCGLLLDGQGEIMPLLARRFAREIGGPEAVPLDASRLAYRAMAKDTVRTMLIQELEDMAEYNRDAEAGEESAMYDSTAGSSSPGWVCYMFREAFADLQMILLFNLEWADYQALFLSEEGRLSAGDCPPRMLAVARALVSTGKWRADSIRTAGHTEAGRSFCGIGEAVLLELSPDGSGDEADAGSKRLQDMDFETDIIFYLSEYLKVCCAEIQEALGKEEKTRLVGELREMHNLLSQKPPVYELEMGLIHFIDHYRSSLIPPPPAKD